MAALSLVIPSLRYLPGYVDALNTGWSPDNTQDIHGEQLTSIRRDAAAFIADLRGGTGPIRHADGRMTARLPDKMFWLWDGEFCGVIGLRWQIGTHDLPPYVRGHIGYAVVPWKRRRGYAAAALGMVLDEARAVGLERVFLTADEDNVASRRVIERNGGILIGPDTIPPTGRFEPGEVGYWIMLRQP
jgi:predicted acetyltransferase